MTETVDNLIIKAESGDPEAQYRLGEYYERNPQLDYKKAASWYLKAAMQGHASAQNELAWLYEKGMGVELSLNESQKWFLMAAEQGHTEAKTKIKNNYHVSDDLRFQVRQAALYQRYKNELLSFFRNYNFNEAETLFNKHSEYIDSIFYQTAKDWYHLLHEIEQLLELFEFIKADFLFTQNLERFCNQNSVKVFLEEYFLKKAEYIKTYSLEILGFDKPLDNSQSKALADLSGNLLVAARAGAGKTTVLTFKGMILAERQYVQDPNAILMLAFNKKAAEEIRQRIQIKHRLPLCNIRTFHSLAHRIVQPTQEISEDYESEMAEYLRSTLEHDPRLKGYLYKFFRSEMQSIENKGLLLNETDYYDFAKYCWESISLGGDRVKSFGEKCIADFLFEYGMTYEYERAFLLFNDDQREIYKPDFTIYDSETGRTFILEHWAIPDKSYYSDHLIWGESGTTERQYAEERNRKRAYWNCDYRRNQNFFLLETDISWLDGGRESFEGRLKKLLESNKLECIKLPQNVLLEKVYRKHSNRLFKLFVSFIQKCRRYGYSPSQIKGKRDQYQTSDPKEQALLRVAPDIYEKYEKNLDETDRLDFDRLIHLAVEKIRTTNGECCICDNKNDINIKIKDLAYILIDEFQDFTRLFYEMTSAIRAVNPAVKLFCVGDDWQAINGFAGSDSKYYHDFVEDYPNAAKKDVLTNYRSGEKIVEAGNRLMDGLGEKSISTESNRNKGMVEIVEMDDYVIEGRDNQADTEDYQRDLRYLNASEIKIRTKEGREWSFKDFDTARYFKAIHQILREHIDILTQPDANCFILTRTNRFGCCSNSGVLKEKLCGVFSEVEKNIIGENRFEEKIQVMTAHKSKGKEADIVFILKCNLRTFPMNHPDNRLFGIFGETEQKVFEEERRLFYVALTRAKKKVFLLTEKNDRSPFLEYLQ